MSTSGGKKEQWNGLEALGMSRKELALAEALQMEYDALSRIRRDSRQSNESPLISWEDVSHSSSSVPSPQRNKPPPSGDYLNIYGDAYQGNGQNDGRRSPKNMSSTVPSHSEVMKYFKEVSSSTDKISQSRDVNVYTEDMGGKLLGRRISEEDTELSRGEECLGLGYEDINDTLTRLNLAPAYDSELLRQAEGHWKDVSSKKVVTGKPVARSNTMPPQLPPRTYVQKQHRNTRASMGPDTMQTYPQHSGCELFEMAEQRDEETAAFCHMLDVLRSGQTMTDQIDTGIVWSPVNLSPEHLGPGVSLKITVIIDSVRDPLTFTCDCELGFVHQYRIIPEPQME